ncbi:MAG TPA: glycosyltransferase family 2 protein [Candidatus Saccharimonadia bacterium]|jgi:cellulose synthase/poly-beta-1,6-N-acetylglucosamine synthase-like glycosyltransferase
MDRSPKRKLALLIPAHNEQMVVADTIRSALDAGQPREDIFLVSDGSTDWTVDLAYLMLDDGHVIQQPQSGKGVAILSGLKYFGIADRYEWVHIADADGVFGPNYFAELTNRLSTKYCAATGHLQSIKAGWISKYRTFEYTLGLEVMRRIQAAIGAIPVIPGATCIYRTDILEHLDFNSESLTEDMDLTIQIHRKKLGKIAFIPQAKAFTQDPKDFSDYFKQVMRWYRGAWQVMLRHKIGLRPHRVDGYMLWMVAEELILLAEITILPFLAWWGQNYGPVSLMFLTDLTIFFGITVWAAGVNNRADVISGFPFFYILRFVNLFAFFRAWYEIVVQHKFRSATPGWSTAGRRYRIATEAVSNN